MFLSYCKTKSKCPIPGRYCTPNVIYQATVSHDSGKKAKYIGSMNLSCDSTTIRKVSETANINQKQPCPNMCGTKN